MATAVNRPGWRSHDEVTIEMFRRDPEFAMAYLDAILQDGDQEELMVALRRMSEAFGGVAKLAASSSLNPTTLYRTLSPKGNPELRSLTALLKAMGMRLAVQPLDKPRTRRTKTGRAKTGRAKSNR